MADLKKRSHLLMLLVFVAASGFLLARPIGDMDELWNYNFGYNICNGLLPYLDFNCIVTPLAPWLSALFLKVFTNSLFAFRVLGSLLLAGTFCLLFWILRTCSGSNSHGFVVTAVLFSLNYFLWIYNYNNLNLLFLLLILFLEMKLDKGGKHPAFLHGAVGFLCGAVLVTKQSIGALMLLYNTTVCAVGWFANWENRRCFPVRFLTSLLLPGGFAVYLFLTDSLPAFWDYAVVGIGTFTHRISYFSFVSENVLGAIIGLFPLVVTGFSLYSIGKGTSVISRRFHVLALAVSWIGLTVAYPLCDFSHMLVGVVPFSVCAYCCRAPRHSSGLLKMACVLFGCSILVGTTAAEVRTAEEYKVCELSNFRGLIIHREREASIKAVDAFILEKEEQGGKVLIADSCAAAYMLPIDRYDKDFSLLNRGNLGTQTLQQMLWREHATYLVFRERDQINKQSHFELIDYITQHYTKTGEVVGFDVYETN